MEFLLCEESGLPGGAVSTACQEGVRRRFLCILNYIASCFQHSTGQDTQAVSIVSVTSAFVFWSACVVSVSPLCQVHSEFLASKAELVSHGNFFVFLFFTRGRNCCFL